MEEKIAFQTTAAISLNISFASPSTLHKNMEENCHTSELLENCTSLTHSMSNHNEARMILKVISP